MLINGVIYFDAVNKVVPAFGSENQLIIPPLVVALNSKLPGPQLAGFITLVIEGIGLIFAKTVVLLKETQPLKIAPA